MSTFLLKILSADRVFFEGPVRSMTIPQEDGEMGILPGHENMAVSMIDGVLRFTTEDGKEQRVVTGIGITSILANEVTVLVSYAEKPEEIDFRRAEEAAERARERLRQKRSIQEYKLSQASLARAMARMSAARKNL